MTLRSSTKAIPLDLVIPLYLSLQPYYSLVCHFLSLSSRFEPYFQAAPPPSPTSTHAIPIHPTPKPDPFYGHEFIARLCARFITHLFTCPESLPSSTHSQAKLPFFIAYALHRTKLHQAVTIAALVLLQRLNARFPTARGSSGHRLFISNQAPPPLSSDGNSTPSCNPYASKTGSIPKTISPEPFIPHQLSFKSYCPPGQWFYPSFSSSS
jgi:hypothetical protein